MVVIRSCFIFYIISFLGSFGQSLTPDSSAVSLTSQSLIEKKIDFPWQGGTLAQALEQLHQKHGFKFSHAGQQINFTYLKPNAFKEAPLGYVLDELLKTTNFDYLLVGRMVVLVKRKPQDMEIGSKDSSKTKNASNPNFNVQPKNHIYSSNLDLNGLSWYEKRVIYKTFKKELRWTQRRITWPEAAKDSSDAEKTSEKAAKNTYDHFMDVSVGIAKPLLSHKDNTSLPWESDMGFKQTSKTTLNAELGLGWVTKRFLFGTGLCYRRISTQSTWTELRRRPIDDIDRSANERYDVVAIPLKALAYKQWGKVYGAAGIALKINFIKLDFSYDNKFRRYYNDNMVGSDYSQKTNKVTLSSAFLITGGMVWKKRYVIAATAAYEPYWRALENNSLYKLFPHQLSLNLGLIYLLDFKIRQVLGY